MKWKKFKDIDINKEFFLFYHGLYITDWCSVWTRFFKSEDEFTKFAINNPDYGCANIPVPDTPENHENHQCELPFRSCYTNERGKLELWLGNKKTGSYLFEVPFCPFCGYGN